MSDITASLALTGDSVLGTSFRVSVNLGGRDRGADAMCVAKALHFAADNDELLGDIVPLACAIAAGRCLGLGDDVRFGTLLAGILQAYLEPVCDDDSDDKDTIEAAKTIKKFLWPLMREAIEHGFVAPDEMIKQLQSIE